MVESSDRYLKLGRMLRPPLRTNLSAVGARLQKHI